MMNKPYRLQKDAFSKKKFKDKMKLMLRKYYWDSDDTVQMEL